MMFFTSGWSWLKMKSVNKVCKLKKNVPEVVYNWLCMKLESLNIKNGWISQWFIYQYPQMEMAFSNTTDPKIDVTCDASLNRCNTEHLTVPNYTKNHQHLKFRKKKHGKWMLNISKCTHVTLTVLSFDPLTTLCISTSVHVTAPDQHYC